MALSRQSESENTCVVCFKNVDIFSVGQCDHPVCYECSTRMRVLCRTQECPICRQMMPKAIFTKAVEQYSNLVSNISNFKKDIDHGIYFSDPSLEARFRRLLEHRCKKCARPGRVYDNFSTLSNHLRREHELYFCELCLEHLRIFTWERKAYSRSDLALHRRKGDVDDKSLKGHPLCEFCDRRYFDKDELYRHLRKDHFFCHFCDADGRNDFYGNYNDLTDHFRKDHFLCEEGDCQRKESYTRVFRSEIDFKAHRTHNHIQGLGKAAAKQARTLELEFQLRPRNDNRGRGRGGTYRGGPRREREQVEERYREPSPVPPPASQIDVENNEEFPSLGNESGASGNGQQSAPRKVVPKNKMTVGSTSRNEEDFPSLGKPTVLVRLSSQDDSNVKIKVKQNYPQASTSSTISQTNTVKSAPGQPRAMVTRVSSTNNIKLQSSTPAGLQQDFPALPSTSKDEFRPQWGRKTEPKPMSHVIEVPKNDFPRLPSISAPPIKHIPPKKASSVNIPVQSGKAGIEPDRSKKKKSKMPIDEDRIDYSLPSDSLGIKIPKHIPNGDLGGSSNIGSKIQLISRADLVNNNQRKPVGKKPEFDDSEFPSLGPSNHVEPDRPFVKKVAEQKKKKQEQQYFNVKENQPPNDKHFGKVDSSRTSNGNRKSDITFTSSSGETFSVTSEIKVADAEPFTNMSNGAGHFVQPPSFGARNNALRDLIHELLGGDADALREFQDISKKFRSGAMSAKNYYELVQDLFGTSSFELVFSDLLVLLPDVSRQQELYEVHKGVSGAAQFTPCAVCGQILAPSDLKHHKVSHTLDNDFPSLI